jgi:hypothetical protein
LEASIGRKNEEVMGGAIKFESALFAEWRALHEKYGTNGAAMPVLYKAVAEIADPFRPRALHTALVAGWVQVDPAAGLKFFFEKGRDSRQGGSSSKNGWRWMRAPRSMVCWRWRDGRPRVGMDESTTADRNFGSVANSRAEGGGPFRPGPDVENDEGHSADRGR